MFVYGHYKTGERRLACRAAWCTTCRRATIAEGKEWELLGHFFFIPLGRHGKVFQWICRDCGRDIDARKPRRPEVVRGMYRLGWWVLGLTLVLALCFSRMEGVPSGATTPFLFTGLLALGLAEYHHRRAQGSHYDQSAAAVPPLKGDLCPLCQRSVPAAQPPRCERCQVLIVTEAGPVD